jgi:ribosomal protein S6--L-glutamate ligase
MSLGKIVVGSEEWCALPHLNIPAIKSRVDSGAKTSALHAINIIPFKKDGYPWVRYEVHPLQNDGKTSIHCESPVIDKRKVKNSSGTSEIRCVVKSIISIAESTWEIELSLTNRDSMGYRKLMKQIMKQLNLDSYQVAWISFLEGVLLTIIFYEFFIR